MPRRILMAMLALLGLLAMHGITASTASAAAPCGQAPTHAVGHSAAHAHEPHERPQAPSDEPVIGVVQTASLTGALPEPEHAGMLCLAIVAMVLLIGLRGSRRLGLAAVPALRSGLPIDTRSPRAPPDPQSVLCRWRT